jgi:hypothetical protein
MVPTSLIMPILLLAFLAGAYQYFCSIWQRSGVLDLGIIMNWEFVLIGVPAALILLILALTVLSIYPAWLSWAVLASAIGWAVYSVPRARNLASARSEAQREKERKMMGR